VQSANIFAESRQVAEFLNISSIDPKSSKSRNRTPQCRTTSACVSNLGSNSKSEMFTRDVKRTWWFGVLDDGDLAEDLDGTLFSDGVRRVWI
jgi:hypothetical protein